MTNFRKLDVWTLSHQLTAQIYKVTNTLPPKELYTLSSQMKRAAYSVPSNITKGSLRGSQREFRRFLLIALGSSAELQYFPLLAKDLQYIKEDSYNNLLNSTEILSRKLQPLIKRVTEDIKRSTTKNQQPRTKTNDNQPNTVAFPPKIAYNLKAYLKL